MPKIKRLIDLDVFEVTLCGKGANAPAKVALFKMDDTEGKDKESNMTKEEFDAAIADIKDDAMKAVVEHLQESKKELDKQLEESKAEIETLKASTDDAEAKEKAEKEAVKKAMADLPDSVKEDFAKQKEENESLRKEAKEHGERIAKIEQEKLHKELEDKISKYPRTISADAKDETIKMLEGMTTEQVEGVTKSWEQSELIAGKAESLFKETGSSLAIVGSASQKIQSLAEEIRKEDPTVRIDVARVQARDANPDLKKAESDEKKGA